MQLFSGLTVAYQIVIPI